MKTSALDKQKHIFFLNSHLIPGGSDSKESACNVGGLGSIPGSGRSPGIGNGMGMELELEMEYWKSSILAWRIPWQRTLEDYSPWGDKESYLIEWFTHTHSHTQWIGILRFYWIFEKNRMIRVKKSTMKLNEFTLKCTCFYSSPSWISFQIQGKRFPWPTA